MTDLNSGCRFPGDVYNTDDFIKIVEGKVNTLSEIPEDRWNMDRYFHPDPHNIGTHAHKRAG